MERRNALPLAYARGAGYAAKGGRMRKASNPKDTRVALDERCLQAKNALAEALKARGHLLDDDAAVVHGERIGYQINEPHHLVQLPVRRGEAGYRAGRAITRSELVPSGQLVLIAYHSANYTGKRRWADKPGKPLERQIDTIATTFEKLAHGMAERRAAKERYDREFAERLRQAGARYRWDEEAKGRPGRLHDMAADWQEVQRMSAFLDALEAHLAKVPSEPLATWLKWARQYVDGLDPFSPMRMADLAAHAAILAVPKVGEPDRDEEEWRCLGMLDEYL